MSAVVEKAFDESKLSTELRDNLAAQNLLWSYKNLSTKKKIRVARSLLKVELTPVNSDNSWTVPS